MSYADLQGTVTPAPVQAAPPPQAPAAPGVSILVPGANGTQHTYTTADIDALRARKDELSHQIQSADSRRKDVQRSLRGAVGADKAGLEQRLGVLDARIARLEKDIDENSSQLASLDVAKASSATAAQRFGGGGGRFSMGMTPASVVMTVCIVALIALTWSRTVFRRNALPQVSAVHPDTTARLERIEQSIESIAIEIERVSEGQRFVTRLMSDSRGTALPAGEPGMEPIALAENRVSEPR